MCFIYKYITINTFLAECFSGNMFDIYFVSALSTKSQSHKRVFEELKNIHV